MSVVGGTASKLGGGKFSNGAVSGAFVHMFNAESGFLTKAKEYIKSFMKERLGGNVLGHFLIIGVHAHATVETYSLCVRGGPGLMLSAGPEASIPLVSIGDSADSLSFGPAIDAALGPIDGGASVLVNDNSINASVAYRGVGWGFSAGGDICYTGKW